ncbi:hypothetical protein M8J75_003022 [Diaphorina citri]|nr:hypothetical protein M8J75_003022 [Diaphorina citri]
MSWIIAPRFVNRLRAQKGQLVTSSDYEKNTIENIIKSHQSYTWGSFMGSIGSSANSQITNILQKLKVLVLNILGGGQDSGAVNDTTFVIIVLFYGEDKVLNRHKNILKSTFGINQDGEVAELHRLVQELSAVLPESGRAFLEQTKQNKANAKQTSREEKLWRSNILKEIPLLKNEINNPTITGSNYQRDWTPPDLSFLNSFTSSKEDPFDKLTLNYDVKGVCEKSIKNGKRWLQKEIKKTFNSEEEMLGLSLEELTESLLSLLKSSKTSDQLQNELFDLIGFERFNLIESLLKHRDEILAAEATQSSALQMPKLAALSSKENQNVINRSTSANGNFDFNSYQTETPRYVQSNNVIAISKTSTQKKTSIYPNVYDLSGSIKSSGSASMAKGSLVIPTNAKRRDTQTYEEVTIPAVELTTDQANYKPVLINQLDEIGQEVFKGVKSLNRIQSLVYDTAYHTNENLLICAPTGAGKTNVAMLTIAHQIKQHISQGVILKDQFKIVYVAPMKALAAEMTSNFGKKLAGLGISVRELTGDMQLKKAEIVQTQMIVTTPEKWDVITRKGTGDVALTELVKLLIIDEVHLLHGDRGPVIEALVARTLRQVESTQSMIRIVGLSATLPNYVDVANFLRVNPYVGLFFFDSRFRPVPLEQTFIGVKPRQMSQQIAEMDNICYEKVAEEVAKGNQVMVFVHARNATGRTANTLKEKAMTKNQIELFEPEGRGVNTKFKVPHLQSKELNQLLQYGFAIHHAGLPRSDRDFVEKAFGSGDIKVLVCTATLAWGVNLPAHAVIIKGTEMYNAKHGCYVHIGILDVLQIFGRHATIITPHEKLNHYLSLLTNQIPIESNFVANLADNLNAEVALGTIGNIDEAVRWLSYSYLHVATDPDLIQHRTTLIENAAQILDKAHMIRFNMRTRDLAITDLGRTASNYYIKHNDIELFTEHMTKVLDDVGILSMISQAHEFEQLKVRDEELHELDNLTQECCEIPIRGGSENVHGKVNILLQTLLSRGRVNSFSLVSDLEYVNQNVIRIIRALFEITLHRNNAIMAARFLKFALMFETKQWPHETPLRQIKLVTNRGYQSPILKPDILNKIEQRGLTVEDLREMPAKEISYMLRDPHVGDKVKQCAWEIPLLEIESKLLPITRTVLKIHLTIKANFSWNDKNKSTYAEPFWIWVEDPDSDFIYHSEYFLLSKKQVITKSEESLIMTIPLSDPLPNQYLIRAMSDRYLGSVVQHSMSFKHLIVPELHPPHTNLLELQPLPVSALQQPQYESLYKFSHFNPIQTQIFHCLYHTDNNVLLGAPTGSGKTIAAEITCFRVFKQCPEAKVVYIAPLKALVKERVADWKVKFEARLKKKVVELTGDVTPDIQAISSASVIVTTPEKWDGVSRSWQNRNYVQSVALIIIDEIHLLGEDRGPVLEVIVSRVNFISSYTKRNVRLVGLSTALANAKDLATWLNITKQGMYNFRPSVRPVPLEVHISGFPGKQYCPRMAKMNKPIYTAIKQHSPEKPVMIFVSSRRQTRLTAIDLITILACETNPKMWVHTSDAEMDNIVDNIKDSNLKLTIAFGIGFHHADRKIVENLFVGLKIQVLIATATLAWGVNFPAHLVIVKGTEYYDGKCKRYVDMPITDVLQMMGRAGRPQFDDSGVAVVMVHDAKKNYYKKFLYEPFPVESSLLPVLPDHFNAEIVHDAKKNYYKKFLYEPFPVESSLLPVLPDHFNAEIVARTIRTTQEAVDYLTWTYFIRRLLQNPMYYNLASLDGQDYTQYLANLVDEAFTKLLDARCIEIDDQDCRSVAPTSMGRIASYYYLSHSTMLTYQQLLKPDLNLAELLAVMCSSYEYSLLPVRHNEEHLNEALCKQCPLPIDPMTFDSANMKAFILLQAHFSRLDLSEYTDYLTDLKSVLDQSIRIIQALIDVTAEYGWLSCAISLQHLMQMIIQALWLQDSPLLQLPHVVKENLHLFRNKNPNTLPGLVTCRTYSDLSRIHRVLSIMPLINVDITLLLPKDINVDVTASSDEDGDSTLTTTSPSTSDQMIPMDDTPVSIQPGKVYTLLVQMRNAHRNRENTVYAPKYSKPKQEGWFLTLGYPRNEELISLKRIYFGRKPDLMNYISFNSPSQRGSFELSLDLISDSYLGLDQQFSLRFHVE